MHSDSAESAGASVGILKLLIWPAIALLSIPALWPLYSQGLPATGDGTLHLQRLLLLDYHLTQGVFYPRWTPELFLG
ncbi:MAG: hypothetical protein HC802_14220, partial [Caldilineaceae bacterium]|nr:hypothetical protein [Caldilineaceae bacterium]